MVDEISTPGFVKADKRYRNTLFLVYIVLLSAGFVFFYVIFPQLIKNSHSLDSSQYYTTAQLLIIGFILAFIAPASYLIAIGKKIKKHTQFPFPGMKVIKDTKVITGKKAIALAKMLIYLGYFACFISIAGSIHVYVVIHKILSSELIRLIPLL
jgi:hypothetical protein